MPGPQTTLHSLNNFCLNTVNQIPLLTPPVCWQIIHFCCFPTRKHSLTCKDLCPKQKIKASDKEMAAEMGIMFNQQTIFFYNKPNKNTWEKALFLNAFSGLKHFPEHTQWRNMLVHFKYFGEIWGKSLSRALYVEHGIACCGLGEQSFWHKSLLSSWWCFITISFHFEILFTSSRLTAKYPLQLFPEQT